MRLESRLKTKAETMASADGLSLADFLGQMIEAEDQRRVWTRTLKQRHAAARRAVIKVEAKLGDNAMPTMLEAIKSGRRSLAGVSLAAWH